MNESEIQFRNTGRAGSQADRLSEAFRARPGVWISMVRLGRDIGAWAVHSRVADLRRRGMAIDNHQKVIKGQRHSFYRYNPAITTP